MERQEIEQSARDGREHSDDDGSLGTRSVSEPAGPYARHQRGQKLGAGDQTDDEGAEAELLMNV